MWVFSSCDMFGVGRGGRVVFLRIGLLILGDF